MTLSSGYQSIIDSLYALYESKGFIYKEEALDLMAAQDISLTDTQQLTEILLGLGVIFADDSPAGQDVDEDDDGIVDKTRTDYEAVFGEVLSIAPGLKTFIHYVQAIRPPQWREWRILMPQAKSGNHYAMNRIFEMYLRVVVNLSLRAYKSYGQELEDLIQEGALGLLRAIISYDPNKHGSFVSYFPMWVRQFMDRAYMDKSRIIRIPVYMHEKLMKFQETVDKLEERTGQTPDIESIAEGMGISVNEVDQISQYCYVFNPIEDYLLESCDGFIDCEFLDGNIDPALDYPLCFETISSVLNTLTKRESEVMRRRFGIDSGQGQTLEEVGIHFNVTRERIRQIEAKALRKLRHPSRSVKLKDILGNI